MYLIYFALWVIFNANLTLEVCLFGIVIAGLIFAFTCKFMDYSIEKEKKLIRRSFLFLRYVVELLIEIVKANMTAIHMIVTEREEIQPTLVRFHCDELKGPVSKVLLANAITLTPGTITVTLEDADYTVHCLDESLAEGIDDSSFVKLLKEMERA